MRILLLMRGAPGAGKSTYIDNEGLRPYALSADEIRLMCQSPQLSPEGRRVISQANDTVVWQTLFNLLQVRMEKGEFTVIDATNSKTAEMNRYKEMCETYRYRIFCVDFTDLPIEECKKRNLLREPLKRVPEAVIDKMYSRFRTQQIPAGIKVIKPDQLDSIFLKKFDFSSYKAVHVIGDIHGCNTALQEFLTKIGGVKDDEFYLFLGDYVDRGLENAEVLRFLISIKDKKNVLMLEGNHERWIWIYANEGHTPSRVFEFKTAPQLDEAIKNGWFTKADLRQLYRRFGQCAYFSFNEKTIFACHGGIPYIPKNLSFVATDQMIHGVGDYKDYSTVARVWSDEYHIHNGFNTYQVFGHRNTGNSIINEFPNVFLLEGRVEFGGDLRCVSFYKEHTDLHYTQNTVFELPEETQKQEEILNKTDLPDVIMTMRNNRLINEKKFGDISSFNFNNKAFFDKIWNEQTMTARGLFIDTKRMKIQARGYAKFFNINERPETKLDMLQYRFKFPVTAYVKYNGFLGLLSYNPETDDLLFSTKAMVEGEFCNYFKDLFNSTVSEENRDKIKRYLKINDVTFAFEVIDQKNDPHIIEYPSSKLVLLDIIYNKIEFEKYPYPLLQIGETLGLQIKEKDATLNNWQEFYDWYNKVSQDDYKRNEEVIEGYVIEDSDGFMVKAKLAYYNFWKFMRAVAQCTIKIGYFRQTSALTTPTANYFYGWLKQKRKEAFENGRLKEIPFDIITLRHLFESEYKIEG